MKTKMNALKGKKVSLLLDVNKNHLLKESYSGVLEEVNDECVTLDLNNPTFYIKKLHVKPELVLSIWEYNPNVNK